MSFILTIVAILQAIMLVVPVVAWSSVLNFCFDLKDESSGKLLMKRLLLLLAAIIGLVLSFSGFKLLENFTIGVVIYFIGVLILIVPPILVVVFEYRRGPVKCLVSRQLWQRLKVGIIGAFVSMVALLIIIVVTIFS